MLLGSAPLPRPVLRRHAAARSHQPAHLWRAASLHARHPPGSPWVEPGHRIGRSGVCDYLLGMCPPCAFPTRLSVPLPVGFYVEARDWAELGRRFRPVLRRGREGFPVVHTHKAGHRARDSGHGALLPLLHPTAPHISAPGQAHLPSFSDDCADPHAGQSAFGAKGGGLAAGGGELFDAPPEFEVRRPGWGTGAGLGRRQTILVGEGSQGEIPAATRLGLLGGGGGRVPRRPA